MREVKFRGKILDEEKIVTGGLIEDERGAMIFDSHIGKFYAVESESVERLICRDITGAEVYESDEVILKSKIEEFIRDELGQILSDAIAKRFTE